MLRHPSGVRSGPLLALALSACAIAAGSAAAQQGSPAAADTTAPAPPPAGYCRVRAPETWPTVNADGATADLSPFQDYRAGLGIDGTARGAGVTIADVEYEWRASHLELAALALPAAAPPPLAPEYRAIEHGTAVLGLLGGADDGQGITGLASAARLLPISPFTSSGSYQPAAAVRSAAERLKAGDVLLIELQGMATDAGGRPLLTPIEVIPAVRDEIRAAVDRGIVVVEPAGNGALDIGGLAAAPWLAGPAAPGHSGALMVGGGGAGRDESGTGDLQRIAGSNFGARVDVQGYGAGVVSSGYGDAPWSPGGDRSFTACFDGTSSAAATVAGAVAVLQGAEIARDGTPLVPAEVRATLIATGTPQVEPSGTPIGPRPDVSRAIAALPTVGIPPPPPPDASPPEPRPATPAVVLPVPVPADATVAGGLAPTLRTLVPVRSLAARLDRRASRVTLRLRGLARGAVVRIGGRRVGVARGAVLLRGVRPRKLIVTVTVPGRAGVVYRGARFRVTIPARGAPRVVRLTRS